MDFIAQLGLAMPEGNFWATLINLFDVGSYAWTILIFTVVLKLVLSPLDFLQRFYTNKQTRMQAKIQPELEKLKARYGQNQTLLYQKQTELYKKNNFSMKGSCIVMIIYMVVTLTVFLTLFNSLQTISNFKINQQFEQLQETYHDSYDVDFENYLQTIDADKTTYLSYENEDEKLNYLVNCYIAKNNSDVNNEQLDSNNEHDVEIAKTAIQTQINTYISNAQDDVVERYDEVKDSWLWVKNIWRSDKPTVTAILSYNDFKSATSTTVSQTEYENVMGKLLNDKQINTVNGYYILSVIVVLVSLLSQYLTRKMSQAKNANGQVVGQTGSTKLLMFILPFAMLMFTLNSSAMFSIYIITNSVVSTAITPVTTVLSNYIENKKEKERKDKNKAEYSR